MDPRNRIMTVLAGVALLAMTFGGQATAQAGKADVTIAAATVGKIFVGNTGNMSDGSTSNGLWNNAPAATAYFVDVSPKGAGFGNTPCQFEVTKQWSQQLLNAPPGGIEREIRWTVKNIGSFTCSADIYLVWVA